MTTQCCSLHVSPVGCETKRVLENSTAATADSTLINDAYFAAQFTLAVVSTTHAEIIKMCWPNKPWMITKKNSSIMRVSTKKKPCRKRNQVMRLIAVHWLTTTCIFWFVKLTRNIMKEGYGLQFKTDSREWSSRYSKKLMSRQGRYLYTRLRGF